MRDRNPGDECQGPVERVVDGDEQIVFREDVQALGPRSHLYTESHTYIWIKCASFIAGECYNI